MTSPSAIALVNAQIRELREGKKRDGSPSKKDPSVRQDELSAVLQELRETKTALLAATRALEQEKQAHEQTKELLRLALRPTDQTPAPIREAADRPSPQRRRTPSPKAGRAASNSPANAVYVPPLGLEEARQSPWRTPPKSGYRPLPRTAKDSSPLQELLNKAAQGTTTPRKTAAETRRAVQDLCGSGHHRHATRDSPAFGSRTPRFQHVSLVGDHQLHSSNRSWSYADDAPGAGNSTKRTPSPATSRRAGTPRQGTPRTHLSERAVRQTLQSPDHPAPAALKMSDSPHQTIKAPDVHHWVQTIQSPVAAPHQ